MRSAFLLVVLSFVSRPAEAAAVDLLFRAVMIGDLKTIETLLSSGLSPDQPDRFGETVLSVAMKNSQTRVVELLLASHADPNAPLRNGKDTGESPVTPLQYAAQTGNQRLASILIGAGARVDATGVAGRTPLHYAAFHLDMMRFLLEKGADVNARDAEGASPLDDAVWNGSLDAAAILLAHGAHLNDIDTQTGATPINEAAFRGNTSVVRYLLQLHADTEIPDKRGYSPIENAIRIGHEDSALLLLGDRHRPEFFEAAIKKDESLVTEALLRNGAQANAALPSGATPLDQAASVGAIKSVRVLLGGGADPNLSGSNGTTPLEDAGLKGFDAIAALLLDHGAQVNHLNAGSGTTALYAAASFGKTSVVKLLLERGANPALCGSSRNSPWQAATANGYNDTAILLRDHKSCQ